MPIYRRITLLPITCRRPLAMQTGGETVQATAHSHKRNASFENVRACQVHGLVMRLGKIRLPGYRTVPPGHGHPDLALRYSPGSSLGQLGSPEMSAAAHSVWTLQGRGYYPPDLHGAGQHLSMADPTSLFVYATQTSQTFAAVLLKRPGRFPEAHAA